MRTPRAEEERMLLGHGDPSNAFACNVLSVNLTTEWILEFLQTDLQALLS